MYNLPFSNQLQNHITLEGHLNERWCSSDEWNWFELHIGKTPYKSIVIININ